MPPSIPATPAAPLVNAHGELVGINTFIISNSGSFAGAGFAIPSQIVRATAEQLIKNGKVEHGYLGISMNDVTPDNAHFFNLQDATGAIVSQVTPDSPASRGGVQTGDVIAQLNGQKIVNGSALQVAVSEMAPGTKIALGMIRDGKPETLNLTVGQFHGNSEVASNDGRGQTARKPASSDLRSADLTPDARQQINAPDQVHGVVVENVRPGQPGRRSGPSAGRCHPRSQPQARATPPASSPARCTRTGRKGSPAAGLVEGQCELSHHSSRSG